MKLCKLFRSTTINSLRKSLYPIHLVRGIEEFFYNENIPFEAGRAWKIDELRVKSSQDLHKLWFVCLKEKNRLLSYQHAKEKSHTTISAQFFEKTEKVNLTMSGIKQVIGEREAIFNARVKLFEKNKNQEENEKKQKIAQENRILQFEIRKQLYMQERQNEILKEYNTQSQFNK